MGSSAFIPTFENAAYGIEWTKNDNDVIRIGNAKFHRELPIQNRLKGCVYNEKKKGVNHADITIDNIQDKCYFIGDQANSNSFITEFDFRFGPYFVPNKVGTNKKADNNEMRGNNGQGTDKAVRVLLLGGCATDGSLAGSDYFTSAWVRSDSNALVGFFTTVKLD
nr:MAG: hypothetical protein [Bacteriophage sp.]